MVKCQSYYIQGVGFKEIEPICDELNLYGCFKSKNIARGRF